MFAYDTFCFIRILIIYFIYLFISAPHAQQRSSSKPKTGSSKSNQTSSNPQTTKPAREKPVPMPNDTR